MGFLLVLLAACTRSADTGKPAPTDGAIEDTAPDCTTLAWAPDTDGDGYGDASAPTVDACEAPEGHVADATDCDDGDAGVHPGATETCDGVDANCDGVDDDATTTWYGDADGDGYGDPSVVSETCTPGEGWVADGTDCDDTDPLVSPGAEEQCDGDDDNCDGVPDLVEVQEWHTDTDGDGYGHPYNYEVTCDPPAGSVLDDNDCRPGDAEAFPGAPERCNDDDDDCDGVVDEDMDADGDGFRSPLCDDGTDCDDADADAWPGNPETCEDGVDQDCDGIDQTCGFYGEFELGTEADAKVYSAEASYDAGRRMLVGDMTGDGVDDLLVTTLYADNFGGGGYVVSGLPTGTVAFDDVAVRISGSYEATYGAGRSVGLGDVDGDGYADLGFGAPYGDFPGMYLVLGPTVADRDLATDPDVWIEAERGNYCGHGADLGDVDGDGAVDAVIGCYAARFGGGTVGGVFVAYGPFADGDTVDVTASPDVTIEGVSANGYAGRWVRTHGDYDGDGQRDLLVAAPYDSTAAPNAGAVYLFYGPPSDMTVADADGVLTGDAANVAFGEGVGVGDLDGDGLDDVFVGAPMNAAYAGAAGAVYAFYGPATGTDDASGADIAIYADDLGGYLGNDVAMRDADSDGRGDLLIGAWSDDTGGVDYGTAWFFSGPAAGSYMTADADASFYGESASSATGMGLAFGDLDADGYSEAYIGANGETTGGWHAGAVYMVLPAY